MLGVLLESRRRRTRRTGGATMSVAIHLFIIGIVAAGTTQLPRHEREGPILMVPIDPPPVARRVTTEVVSSVPRAPTFASPTIRNLRIALPDIPSIELPQNVAMEPRPGIVDFAINRGLSRYVAGIVGGDSGTAGTGGSGIWSGSETLMRITSPVRPRYPEVLRSAGVGGIVLIQFVVDTAGRVDIKSVRTLRSTHDPFTRAVLEVLPRLHFRPTEIDGRRVPALAEMPFEFVISSR
jgi:protein TonB